MGSPWLDGINLRNSDELFATLKDYNQVRSIVWGHVHQCSDQEHNGIRMLSSPSTCAQFKPNTEAFMLDDLPPGYRWLELKPDGGIDTEVVWLS